ncbi:MAG: ATP synthase F0 subunit C [Malacoplasma sp.]|nr:ATP synthase F0 subunit C [Malacoplasma sp.]
MDAEILNHLTKVVHALNEASDQSAYFGAYLGAGIAVLGGIGTGISQGIAAGRAAEAVGRNPEAESKIRTMMIVGCAIAETSAIYSLIIAILLIFVANPK